MISNKPIWGEVVLHTYYLINESIIFLKILPDLYAIFQLIIALQLAFLPFDLYFLFMIKRALSLQSCYHGDKATRIISKNIYIHAE